MSFFKEKLEIFKNNFKKFWRNTSKSNLPQELIEITEKFIISDSFKNVSNYWHIINIKNYKQLMKTGIDSYSVNIALSYFTFVYFDDKLIENTFKNVENVKINYELDLFKKHQLLNYDQSYKYNLLLILLYENLKKLEEYKLLKLLNNETFCGFNDPFLKIEGIKITQDKINSLLEYHSIKSIPCFSKANNTILEMGAGSGRIAEVILNFNEKFKYVICDIPLAIFISYSRLKKAFPKKKISLCIDTKDKEEMMNKLLNNDILFIFPHQIQFFERKTFDIFFAIDCLHEMDKKTIIKYMNYADIYSKYLYFTAWNKTRVPFSMFKNELSAYSNVDYSINKNWKKIFIKNSIFPSNFIQLCYKVEN